MFFVSKKKFNQMQEWANRNQDAFLSCSHEMYRCMIQMQLLADALEDIRSQQTKASNATVTRMVKIAEKALTDYEAEFATEENEAE